MLIVALIFFAYLLGSICCAIIVCKLFHLPDPCSTGSNNPGATNVLRIAGKSKAAIVLAGDMLKGLIPVLLGHFFSFNYFEIGIIGFFAIIGHTFPVFYAFRGGKGVATAIGVYFGLSGWLGLCCLVIWMTVFKCFRYASLSSIFMVALAPVFGLYLIGKNTWISLLFIAILVIFNHRQNISRLLAKKEPKFSQKSIV